MSFQFVQFSIGSRVLDNAFSVYSLLFHHSLLIYNTNHHYHNSLRDLTFWSNLFYVLWAKHYAKIDGIYYKFTLTGNTRVAILTKGCQYSNNSTQFSEKNLFPVLFSIYFDSNFPRNFEQVWISVSVVSSSTDEVVVTHFATSPIDFSYFLQWEKSFPMASQVIKPGSQGQQLLSHTSHWTIPPQAT